MKRYYPLLLAITFIGLMCSSFHFYYPQSKTFSNSNDKEPSPPNPKQNKPKRVPKQTRSHSEPSENYNRRLHLRQWMKSWDSRADVADNSNTPKRNVSPPQFQSKYLSESIAQKHERFAEYILINNSHRPCGPNPGVDKSGSRKELSSLAFSRHRPYVDKLLPYQYKEDGGKRMGDDSKHASLSDLGSYCSKIDGLCSSGSQVLLRLKEYLQINGTSTASDEGIDATLPWPDGGTAR